MSVKTFAELSLRLVTFWFIFSLCVCVCVCEHCSHPQHQSHQPQWRLDHRGCHCHHHRRQLLWRPAGYLWNHAGVERGESTSVVLTVKSMCGIYAEAISPKVPTSDWIQKPFIYSLGATPKKKKKKKLCQKQNKGNIAIFHITTFLHLSKPKIYLNCEINRFYTLNPASSVILAGKVPQEVTYAVDTKDWEPLDYFASLLWFFLQPKKKKCSAIFHANTITEADFIFLISVLLSISLRLLGIFAHRTI